MKLSLLSKQVEIDRIIEKHAKLNNIKIHNFANVGNHLHLVASFKLRRQMQKFLKVVASLIARLMTGARKGKPFGKFWDSVAFSRVINGLRDLKGVMNYVTANQIEAKFGKLEREIHLLMSKPEKQLDDFVTKFGRWVRRLEKSEPRRSSCSEPG